MPKNPRIVKNTATKKPEGKTSLEPLMKSPDYTRQKHKVGASGPTPDRLPKFHALLEAEAKTAKSGFNVRNVLFVDENYELLLPLDSGVQAGPIPIRFKGQLEDLPIKGDIFKTTPSDGTAPRRFEVLRRERVLYRALNRPEKIYIVLKEI